MPSQAPLPLPYRPLAPRQSVAKRYHQGVEDHLAALRAPECPGDDARIAAWFNHAEEEVAVLAAQRFGGMRGPKSQAAARARIAREPDLWTPFLAAFAPAGRHDDPVRPALRRTTEWLRQQTEAEAVLELVRSVESVHVRRLVAARTPVWSGALLRALMAADPDGNVFSVAMAENPSLVDEQAQILCSSSWERATCPATSFKETSWNRHRRADVLRALARRGVHPLGGEPVGEEVLDLIKRHGKSKARLAADLLEPAIALLAIDADAGLIGPGDWDIYYDAVRVNNRAVGRLLELEGAPVALAMRAVEDFPRNLVITNRVSKNRRFMRDGGLRRALLAGSTNPGILARVKPYAEPGELDDYVARALATNPGSTVKGLQRAVGQGPQIALHPETVSSILASSDKDGARVGVIGVLHTLEVRDDAPKPLRRGRRR